MPIYTYKCDSCEETLELFSYIANRDDERHCDKGHVLVRTLDRPGLVWAPTAGGYR